MGLRDVRPRSYGWRLVLVALVTLAIQIPVLAESSDQFGRRHDFTTGGTYTVIDFAASWCEPCYQALPELQALAASTPHVRFLVVSVDDDVAGRDRLIVDLELRLPVIWDEGHDLIEHFDPEGFPATYVLDPSGEVVHRHVGYSKKKWRRLVDFLKRPSVAGVAPRDLGSPR